MRLGVLVSGRGSNLEAVLRARPRGIEPAVVISNRPGVRALDVAASHGVECLVLRRVDFAGRREARDAAIADALTARGVDVALLAGYDQVLSRSYFDRFGGRTINVHPSLLPAHGGTGMVGLAVHRSVLSAADAETGATVHEVTPDVDAGPVLAQAPVPVLEGDDAETLAARVLEVEHRLVVSVLADLAAGSSGPRALRSDAVLARRERRRSAVAPAGGA